MAALAEGKILVTGARGFLGWHLRLRLLEMGCADVVVVGRDDWTNLGDRLDGVTTVFHLAGINRDSDDVIENGNLDLAVKLQEAFGTNAPSKVVFANTILAGADTPYGRGKTAAADHLRVWMEERGGSYIDLRLPNLFGEHGRPFYNSFVATFVELVVNGKAPDIQDRDVPLLHVQEAARALIDAAGSTESVVEPVGKLVRVRDVWDLLVHQHGYYERGEIPDISEPFHRDLFNTLRARMFLDRPDIALTKNVDARGTFVETARVRGGQGQTSFSTTVPGITRGNHFHLRKVERFVVLNGSACISLVKVLGTADERVDLDVNGDEPVAVDMPIGWAHNIRNTGDSTLITQFWINELYNASDPDTCPHDVPLRSAVSA
ncbi:polysaccharide biosynthesis C-terminal domain-containing protein [Brachybacterium sp. AOP24-D1-21]|uniref:polysaccharide biosynthesis C-terminal domain-containing protein n=1 Tax=Brachybacterium sp. AOP24-D1-21 TaxID=3457711 RepID=UPI0040342323